MWLWQMLSELSSDLWLIVSICRVTAISPGAVQTEFSNIRFKVSGCLGLNRLGSPLCLHEVIADSSASASLCLPCAAPQASVSYEEMSKMSLGMNHEACRVIQKLRMLSTVGYNHLQQVTHDIDSNWSVI